MKAHCLFEQSGTFKNEFKKLGIEAYDYDILNEYGETDYQTDLFKEIKNAYRGGSSIFDNMSSEDVILAFFPCTYFQSYHSAWFQCRTLQTKRCSDLEKLEFVHGRHIDLHNNYERFCELCMVVLRKGLRMIIENPYTQPHYLTRYFPIQPALIDQDRTARGDVMEKPTQYWFIGCKPENNFIFEPVTMKEIKRIDKARGDKHTKAKHRSEIHPDYARRFIREFILTGDNR